MLVLETWNLGASMTSGSVSFGCSITTGSALGFGVGAFAFGFALGLGGTNGDFFPSIKSVNLLMFLLRMSVSYVYEKIGASANLGKPR